MFGVKSSVIEESLMLLHALKERNIVVLAPATEGMEEEDGVLVSELEELFAGILEEEDMSIMERVAHLEGVDGVGISLFDDRLNLGRSLSVLVHVVVEGNLAEEVHVGARDEEVSLFHNSLGLGVLGGKGSERAGADFFLAVLVEDGLVNDGEDLLGEFGALDGDLLLTFEGSLLLSGHVLGDWDREEVTFAFRVGEGLHVHNFEELELGHESFEGEGPAVSDGLEVLALVFIEIDEFEAGGFSILLSGGLFDERLGNIALSL